MGAELQAESEQDVSVTLSKEPPPQASQPQLQPDPIKLDKEAVRAATIRAAEQGIDPFSMTVGDLNQGQSAVPPKAQAEPPVEVPEKFKKPNGEVDVEKLKASTERLDEAIQKKETALQKSVDDYVKAYKEKEAKFKNLPNPEKLNPAIQQVPPPPPPPQVPVDMAQLRQKIAEDLQKDFVGTTFDLIDIAVNRRLSQEIAPLKQDAEELRIERQDRQLRQNLQDLAEKNPIILDPTIFSAIQAKLDAEPDLWNRKNPHRAAWLEVKDEMRLGDTPSGVPAQPSRSPSPILGGGTPPPTPSSSDGHLSVDTLLEAAKQLGRDPRDGVKYDPKQHANMQRAAKELFDRLDRQARR